MAHLNQNRKAGHSRFRRISVYHLPLAVILFLLLPLHPDRMALRLFLPQLLPALLPRERQDRLLRRRGVSARLPLGTALRRGAADNRRARQRMRLLLALHDEVPLLPELPVELEGRGRGRLRAAPFGNIARACSEGQLLQLEPRIAHSIPSLHPRRSGAACLQGNQDPLRVELVRIRVSRDAA